MKEASCRRCASITRTCLEPMGQEIQMRYDNISCLVSENINQELTREVTEEEVRVATFQMGGSLAPSLDGFVGIFYQWF